MTDDLLRRIWRCFGRPYVPPVKGADLAAVDERLSDLERLQRDINARLLLLEKQADPRGWRHRHE